MGGIVEQLPDLIGQHKVVPALLHGDLWGGNCGSDTDSGVPLLFDPAPYYGDREADLAMTELFGGFSAAFYSSYRSNYSIEEGYKRRKAVYNLYNALNHFNLFGAGYQPMVSGLLQQIV